MQHTLALMFLIPLWLNRAAVDGKVEAYFNRAFGIDTTAVSEEIVEKRRVAWWGHTGRPLLTVFAWVLAAVHAVRVVRWGIEESMPGIMVVFFLVLAAAAATFPSVKWAVIVHRSTVIVLPVILQAIFYWFNVVPMQEHGFKKMLAGPVLANALFATSTTPSFSTFVARHTKTLSTCCILRCASAGALIGCALCPPRVLHGRYGTRASGSPLNVVGAFFARTP